MRSGNAGKLVASDIEQQPDVLSEVLDLNAHALATAKRFLDDSSLVRLVGIGSSKHAAGYGARAFDLFAELPAVLLPSPGAANPLPRLSPDHLMVIVSQSGNTPALLEPAVKARREGCRIIAIVNAPGSHLATIADVTLDCAAGPEQVIPATKSVTAQMLLLLALARSISKIQVGHLVRAAKKTLDEIDFEDAIRGNTPQRVVCGGFAAEWIADEIALKFAEMAGLAVTSESVVEYFHGPAGAPATTLAFLDPQDPNARVLMDGKRNVTVGPSPSFDVVTPTTSDPALDAVIRLIAGQRTVLEWAKELGEDPDGDRGLAKVTHTL